jgi:hypothetical protein
MAEAISLAKELNDIHDLASALGSAANLGQCGVILGKWNASHQI